MNDDDNIHNYLAAITQVNLCGTIGNFLSQLQTESYLSISLCR